jgi:hypothetical protein
VTLFLPAPFENAPTFKAICALISLACPRLDIPAFSQLTSYGSDVAVVTGILVYGVAFVSGP